MNEQFVTYHIAKKLKDLGFKEECLRWQVHERGSQTDDPIFLQYKRDDDFVYLPLWQQTIDWLRQTHKISVQVSSFPVYNGQYGISVTKHTNGSGWEPLAGETYEKARETAILKALESINAKNN